MPVYLLIYLLEVSLRAYVVASASNGGVVVSNALVRM